MDLLIAFGIFVLLATAIFAFGAALLAPASTMGMRLRSLLNVSASRETKPGVRERMEQVLVPVSRVLPKSPEEVSRTRLQLMQAGYREWKHINIYFGSRILLAGVAALLVLLTGWFTSSPLLLIALPAFGYVLPRFILKRKIAHRQLNIRLGLPDALDLMVICVEAGLGLDQAVQRVGMELKHVHPALSEEFDLAHLEIRAGKPRLEALRNLASRSGVDDLRSLVAVLVQTERFGTSVAQALRVHSDSLRTERRQRAEEQAAKTTIKMIPVLVFFVFPAMFVVTLGPAAIQLIRYLLPEINH